MKYSIYKVVFGAIAVLVVIAALSTFVFNAKPSAQSTSVSGLPTYGPAPDISGISYWINSQPLHMSALKGKVVLVDFWTYSCINCIRTLPYIEAWQRKYGNNGLVIIGVHTPEFQFEKNYTNVYQAVQRLGVNYPVAMDSNYSTWLAYNNRYWPADYLIDKDGNIRDVHIGEGDYAKTEALIQALLRDAGYTAGSNITNITTATNLFAIASPELYLGYSTARAPFGNTQGFSPDHTVNYTFGNITKANAAYLSGQWYDAADGVIAVNNSRLFLVYRSKDVNIVAGGKSKLQVKVDGSSAIGQYLGRDAQQIGGNATVYVNGSRLYNIVSGPSYAQHIVEIDASPGAKIYTFTFG